MIEKIMIIPVVLTILLILINFIVNISSKTDIEEREYEEELDRIRSKRIPNSLFENGKSLSEGLFILESKVLELEKQILNLKEL